MIFSSASNDSEKESHTIKNQQKIIKKEDKFNWRYYLDLYPDLQEIKNEADAFNHWVMNGKNENRRCFPEEILNIKKNTVEKDKMTDSKNVEKDNVSNNNLKFREQQKLNYKFDWRYYLSSYQDLNNIKTEENALKHWNRYGRNENRKCYPDEVLNNNIETTTKREIFPKLPIINLKKKDLPDKNNLKVCITLVPRQTSFGGGNQFVNSLIDYLNKHNINIVHTLEENINLIFIIDPRINSSNKIDIDSVIDYKQKNPGTYIIQRINDCDKPRGNHNVLDPLHLKGFEIADHVIFVSDWVYQYFKINYNFNQDYSIINNGCNTQVFKPLKEMCPPKKNKIKLVSHHWSTNYNKGFEFYNALDQLMSTRDDIEFTFICKSYCKEYKPKNIRVIGPFCGKELAEEINKHDVYITASKFESCPNHVIEGLACGLPILYYKDLGGGVEICQNYGICFGNLDQLLISIEKMKQEYSYYYRKLNEDNQNNKFSSDLCSQKYLNVFNNLWIKNVSYWMIKIEKLNYQWSLHGNNNCRLGCLSLFLKLGVSLKNHVKINYEKVISEIYTLKNDEDIFSHQFEDQNSIIAEHRQCLSALYNMNIHLNLKPTIFKYYQEPLYFMNNSTWKNPWGAGAQLSHYLFFCVYYKQNPILIKKVLRDLEKYKHSDGWYSEKTSDKKRINGIMKILTGFDIIKKLIDQDMAVTIIDSILDTKKISSGGCSIYDLCYVIIRCHERVNHRSSECYQFVEDIYQVCIQHQQSDGGFKYDKDNDFGTKYYGVKIVPDGFYGCVHPTVLFMNTLAMIDKFLNKGLNLQFLIS